MIKFNEKLRENFFEISGLPYAVNRASNIIEVKDFINGEPSLLVMKRVEVDLGNVKIAQMFVEQLNESSVSHYGALYKDIKRFLDLVIKENEAKIKKIWDSEMGPMEKKLEGLNSLEDAKKIDANFSASVERTLKAFSEKVKVMEILSLPPDEATKLTFFSSFLEIATKVAKFDIFKKEKFLEAIVSSREILKYFFLFQFWDKEKEEQLLHYFSGDILRVSKEKGGKFDFSKLVVSTDDEVKFLNHQ